VNGTDQLASVRTYDEPVRFWFPPRTLCCSLVVRKEMMSSRSYPTVSAWPVVLLGTYLYSLHFQISRSPDGSFAQEYKMDRCTFSRNTNAVKLSKVWGKASSLNGCRRRKERPRPPATAMIKVMNGRSLLYPHRQLTGRLAHAVPGTAAGVAAFPSWPSILRYPTPLRAENAVTNASGYQAISSCSVTPNLFWIGVDRTEINSI
jgi:hypothetical protein